MSGLKVLDHLTLADGELFHDSKGRPCPVPVPLAPLADTHGHLGSLKLHDPALALARAALVGVRMLVVPIDPAGEFPRKWGSATELLDFLDTHVEIAHMCLDEAAEQGFVSPAFEGWGVPDLLDNVHIVVGSHPYGAADYDEAAEALTRELLASPRAVGVGEIGLDFGPYNEVDAAVQIDAFRRQLRLAHELNLPVELHIRDAAGDSGCTAHRLAADILREEGVPAAGCDLHCFTSSVHVMEDFKQLGCHIAYGGAATFSRSDDIRKALVLTPERYIITETDCPFMAPVPLRGEECEPAMVAFVAELVARVRAEAGVETPENTYRSLWRNACALFGMPPGEPARAC
ncbi:TatD family hydrolase [Paratractidigestivibacter sp.]|uniref:TatD family hydrolase n=1 Tax=Paratractidigestivibacter sp. TaxID=2847316 RepID=UPI002ACB0F90|nr:TatD family hydrolase [Paratractidigestivibacter sp.]